MYGQRILLLIPHPDDEVVGCCAAILRARAAGARVFGLYLTTGVPAAETLWPWRRHGHADRVARRWRESLLVADRLGIEIAGCLTGPSRGLKDRLADANIRALEITAAARIDHIWTPAYEGGHQDHDAANFLASRLADRAPVWEFSEYNFAGGRVNSQRFAQPNGTEHVLNLSADEAATKRALLDAYASERGNLGYVRTGREAFRPLATYDYSRPPHPGRLFYQRFQWVPRHPRIDYTKPDDVCRAFAAWRPDFPMADDDFRAAS